MKKRRAFRALSALSIAVLLLTGLLGGALADGEDSSPVVTDEYRNQLIYGPNSATADYLLGPASQFGLFAKKLVIAPNGVGADMVGRVAADEFSVDSSYIYAQGAVKFGYPIQGLGPEYAGDPAGNPYIGVGATIICNNSESGSFGYMEPSYGESGGKKHIFVCSDDVTEMLSAYTDTKAKIVDRTIKVPKNSVIDFDAEFTRLEALSLQMADLENITAQVTMSYQVTLKGTDPKVNIFTIPADRFASISDLSITVPESSSVIINVGGKVITFPIGIYNGMKLNGQAVGNNKTNNQVLFNFFEAEEVNIYSSSTGSILAPKAVVTDGACGTPGSHNNGQIIAKEIRLNSEMGQFAFTGPSDLLDMSNTNLVKRSEAVRYTAHYLYYDIPAYGSTERAIREMNGTMYNMMIGIGAAPNAASDSLGSAYSVGDTLTAVTAANRNAVSAMDGMPQQYKELAQKGFNFTLAVYEDGKDWTEAVTGAALTNPATYASMTKKDNIQWNETYTFGESNVYFILYPALSVSVNVQWDDKSDKSGKRPDEFTVRVQEMVEASSGNPSIVGGNTYDLTFDANTQTVKTGNEYSGFANGQVYYDKQTNVLVFPDIPLFSYQERADGTLSNRQYDGSASMFGNNGLFQISVPDTPSDYKLEPINIKAGNDTAIDCTITAHGIYHALFYVVNPDGTRTERYYPMYGSFSESDGAKYVDKFGPANDGMPGTYDIVNNVPNGYSVVWKDTDTGLTYQPYNPMNIDYTDRVFEAVVRRQDVLNQKPWINYYAIGRNGNYSIPGKDIYYRLTTDDYFDPTNGGYHFITDIKPYGYNNDLKNPLVYGKDMFSLLSISVGVDKERAASTRITISKYGYNSTDYIFYDTQAVPSTPDTIGLQTTFVGTKDRAPQTIQELLPQDPYRNDYDGMRTVRLVLPSEAYSNETLYITVYYIDQNGLESVWGYYRLNLKNWFASLVKVQG